MSKAHQFSYKTSTKARETLRAMEDHLAQSGYFATVGLELENYFFFERRRFWRSLVKDPQIEGYIKDHFSGYDPYLYLNIPPYTAVLQDMHTRGLISDGQFRRAWPSGLDKETQLPKIEKKVERWLKLWHKKTLGFYVATSTPPADVRTAVDFLLEQGKMSKQEADIIHGIDEVGDITSYLRNELETIVSVIAGEIDWDDKDAVGHALDLLHITDSSHPLLESHSLLINILQYPDVETYLQNTFPYQLTPVEVKVKTKAGDITYEAAQTQQLHMQKPDPYTIILAALKRDNIISQDKFDELSSAYGDIVAIERNNLMLRQTAGVSEDFFIRATTIKGRGKGLASTDHAALILGSIEQAYQYRDYIPRGDGTMHLTPERADRSIELWHAEYTAVKTLNDHFEIIARYDTPSRIGELFEHHTQIADSVAARYGAYVGMPEKAQGQSRHMHLDIRHVDDPQLLVTTGLREHFGQSESIFKDNKDLLEQMAQEVTKAMEQLFPLVSSDPISPKKRTNFEPSRFGEITFKDEADKNKGFGTRIIPKETQPDNLDKSAGGERLESRYADGTANGYLAVAANMAGLLAGLEKTGMIPPFIHPDFTHDMKGQEGEELKESFESFLETLLANKIYSDKEQMQPDNILHALRRDNAITEAQQQVLNTCFKECIAALEASPKLSSFVERLSRGQAPDFTYRRDIHRNIKTALDHMEAADLELATKIGPKLYDYVLKDYGRGADMHAGSAR